MIERLRDCLNERVPDGFRDDDGVWHDGPLLIDALADLDSLRSTVTVPEIDLPAAATPEDATPPEGTER